MVKIALEHFEKMMAFDVVANNACIEVEFHVDNSLGYAACWLGKTINRETLQAVYWYGLTADGLQAYNFDSLDDFINAPVFNGKSIKEIWDTVTFTSIDSCDVTCRMMGYMNPRLSMILRGPAT